jgi:AraC-like DNA-binding protein/mannose-6-phosphate isomerase-like protein (cupin superfamily)
MEHLHFYPTQEKSIVFHPHIVFSGTLKAGPGWRNGEHRHSFCEIMYVAGGTGLVCIDEQRYEIKTGDVVVYNAGLFHEEWNTGAELHILFFAVDNLRIPGMGDDCVVPDGVCPVIGSGSFDDVLKNFLSVMVNELERKQAHYLAISTSIATMFCHYIFRLYNIKTENPQQTDVCNRAKQFIDSYYNSDISLDTLAGNVHMSKYHLIHIFKENTGMTPMKYLLHARMTAARDLLRRTELPIGEIAGMVGYGNVLAFSRVFKNSEGVTPTDYREKSRTAAGAELSESISQ